MMTSGGSEADLSDAVSAKNKTKQTKTKKQKNKTMSIVRMINDNVVTKHSTQNYLTAVTNK